MQSYSFTHLRVFFFEKQQQFIFYFNLSCFRFGSVRKKNCNEKQNSIQQRSSTTVLTNKFRSKIKAIEMTSIITISNRHTHTHTLKSNVFLHNNKYHLIMSEEIVCVILYQHMRSLLLQNKALVFIRCVLIQFVLLLLGDRFTELQTRQLNRELCCYSVRRVAWFLRCKLLSSQDIFHFTLTYNILHFINHTLSLFFG